MEYFRLMQDKRYHGAVRFDIFSLFMSIGPLSDNYHKLDPLTTRQIKIDRYSFFPDVLDMQLYLVSDVMFELLSRFMPHLDYRIFCLMDKKREIYHYYYAYVFIPLDCFSGKSEANRDRSVIDKLVLRKDVIQGQDIFKVDDVKCHVLVVSLPVAEAILRRSFKGIRLVRTELE
jgi:hypothetical protein